MKIMIRCNDRNFVCVCVRNYVLNNVITAEDFDIDQVDKTGGDGAVI